LCKDALNISQENREHNIEKFYLTNALFPKKGVGFTLKNSIKYFCKRCLEELEIHGLQSKEDVLLTQHEPPAVLQADLGDSARETVQDGLYDDVVQWPEAALLNSMNRYSEPLELVTINEPLKC
jgi:hypothetical protein